jgi:hypothetical protein
MPSVTTGPYRGPPLSSLDLPLRARSLAIAPFPVPDFWKILAMLVDVVLVFDELVLHHLLQIRSLGAQMRHAIDHIPQQVEPVQIVLPAGGPASDTR